MTTPASAPPNTIPWPPILYIGAALLGYGLHTLWPLPWPADAARATLLMAGVFMLCCAFAIELATALAFQKHKTTILPHRAARHLITSGPFKFSRNPIYLANTMLLAGSGLIFGIVWFVVAALTAALLTQHLAIKREERHLAEKFGQEWTTYAAATRRWL
jgi:protein-S-isoprenylcysteine O-methyltransferase Ste14